MKACIGPFKKEAECKLPSLQPQEPLIKVPTNRHPPLFGAALEYMPEFHKQNLINNLYSLPKVCEESLDLVLIGSDTEQIIQKWSDLG